MGNDISSGLSFKAVCFDFHSTNVGISVLRTCSNAWCIKNRTKHSGKTFGTIFDVLDVTTGFKVITL